MKRTVAAVLAALCLLCIVLLYDSQDTQEEVLGSEGSKEFRSSPHKPKSVSDQARLPAPSDSAGTLRVPGLLDGGPSAPKRESARGLTRKMYSPVKVHGRVMYRNGEPVGSARLRIRRLLAGKAQGPVFATTDDAGRYRVSLPAPQIYSVDVQWVDEFEQPLALAANVTLRTSGLSQTQSQDFQVPNRGLLQLRVVGPDNSPLPDTSVRIAPTGLAGGRVLIVRSDNDGEVAQELAEGNYHLMAFVAVLGWAGETQLRIGDSLTRATLRLSPVAHVLRGRVVDHETRSPLNARVEVFREGQRHSAPGEVPVSYETDDSGLFAVPIFENSVFWIRVRSSGYKEFGSDSLDFSDASDLPSDILVEMERGLEVAGEVRDWNGDLVPNSQVHLRYSRPDGSLTQITAQADDHGQFRFEGLSSREVQVWADFSYGRSDVKTLAAPDSSVLLELQPAGLIEGEVIWADGSPFGEPFRLLLIRSGPISVDSFVPVPGLHQDPRGRFSISAIPPGRYRLKVNSVVSGEESSSKAGLSAQSKEFEVTLDEAPHLVIIMGAEDPQ